MKGWQAYRSLTKNLAEKVIEANLKREQDKEKEPKEDLKPQKIEEPVKQADEGDENSEKSDNDFQKAIKEAFEDK